MQRIGSLQNGRNDYGIRRCTMKVKLITGGTIINANHMGEANVIIEDENHLFEYFKHFSILSLLIFAMLVNPLLNPVEILMDYIYHLYWFIMS